MFNDSVKIQMSQNGIPVGFTMLIRKGHIAILGDVYIYNHSRSIFRFFPWLKVGKNYRRLGHGSDLLLKTIEFCKKHGIEEIKGEVRGDLAILVPWYRQLGFTVHNNNEIHLKLYA